MQVLKYHRNILIRPIAVAIFFAAILGLQLDCQAQQRGLFHRGARLHRPAPSDGAVQREAQAHPDPFQVDPQSMPRYQTDWRRDPSYFPAAPMYPKFYGGFHSSEFSRLGVPSGDLGFRGNGIYWTPW